MAEKESTRVGIYIRREREGEKTRVTSVARAREQHTRLYTNTHRALLEHARAAAGHATTFLKPYRDIDKIVTSIYLYLAVVVSPLASFFFHFHGCRERANAIESFFSPYLYVYECCIYIISDKEYM